MTSPRYFNVTPPLEAKEIVLDCRWLGKRGAGAVTGSLLAGLNESRELSWHLWGNSELLEPFRPWAASIVDCKDSPGELFGQRRPIDLPNGVPILFMHQTRPLRHRDCLVLIYDSLQVRHAPTYARPLRRHFLRASVQRSRAAFTISPWSQAAIFSDLRLATPLQVLPVPVRRTFVDAILTIKSKAIETQSTPYILYVGLIAAHKNLERLVLAFAESESRRTGTLLVLAGGEPKACDALRVFVSESKITGIQVLGYVSDDYLVTLYAGCLSLVQPSLEEGFGLPVAEALASGIPVSCSDGGALPFVAGSLATYFDPTSIDQMRLALDSAHLEALQPDWADRCREYRQRLQTDRGYAESVESVVSSVLEAGSRPQTSHKGSPQIFVRKMVRRIKRCGSKRWDHS
jgi:glycosyltransferase involved in cell wall biosynthesis